MRVAVTGAAGQLGRQVVAALAAAGHEPVGWTRAELDVTDREEARHRLREARPEALIHTAGYTAVDRAEAEPEEARAVNERGAANVAEACASVGVRLIHVSTDYVFDGRKRTPYAPTDSPNPLNVYGATKLAGEDRVRAAGGEHLIVRTSWVYGAGGVNFLKTMLGRAARGERLQVVDDQVGSPTWAGSLAPRLVALVERSACGTLHLTDDTRGPGGAGLSWHAFARAILEEAGVRAELDAVPTSAMPRPAARPAYSVLDLTDAERELGAPPPHWAESLRSALTELRSSAGVP